MAPDSAAGGDLDALKMEVAEEIGFFPDHLGQPRPADRRAYKSALDAAKYEVAEELGIPLSPGYNGELTARDAGRIGGRLGGRLGGQMVRRMIHMAEEALAQGGPQA